jgi:protocatechuate 3,4-dioxygenase beta subunit
MTAAGAVIWTVIALGAQPSQPQAPPPTGLIVGRVVDAASGRPIAGAIVSLNGAVGAPPNSPGASRQPRAMTNASGQFVFYTQVFYPGAASVPQATPIAVRAGEERSGVDFTIQYSPVVRVEGTILSPAGTPTAARVNLVVNDPSASPGGIESIRSAQAGADGRFTFAEIAPGPYVMSAHMTQPGGPGERLQMFSVMSDLDVQSDVSGLSLTLQEGLTVSGRLRFDGDGPAPNLASLRVSLMPAQSTVGVTISTGSMTTAADGRFTLPGVSPGRYRLAVNQPSPQVPWVVRSATLLGQDALDVPVDVRQSVTDAAIVLTDRKSELSGKVEAPAGGSTDYTMLLFSTDRLHWAPQSRRILSARTANDGAFVFRNVPPGEYNLVAVDDVEPGEWFDPAFLQRLVQGALRVTIAEGEKKVQDIRVGER